MLAGAISREAELEKFCLKKESSIMLDVKYDGERTLISFKRGRELEMVSRNGKDQSAVYRFIRQQIQRDLSRTTI
jgi:ATP-dependent DNA ligase